jgi:hypothetical protein
VCVYNCTEEHAKKLSPCSSSTDCRNYSTIALSTVPPFHHDHYCVNILDMCVAHWTTDKPANKHNSENFIPGVSVRGGYSDRPKYLFPKQYIRTKKLLCILIMDMSPVIYKYNVQLILHLQNKFITDNIRGQPNTFIFSECVIISLPAVKRSKHTWWCKSCSPLFFPLVNNDNVIYTNETHLILQQNEKCIICPLRSLLYGVLIAIFSFMKEA